MPIAVAVMVAASAAVVLGHPLVAYDTNPAQRIVLQPVAAASNTAPAVARIAAAAVAVRLDVAASPDLVASAREIGLTVDQVVMQSKGIATMILGNYIFSWKDDKDFLFPELASRQAHYDSYFGALEREISAACKANDYEMATALAQRYVREWGTYRVEKPKRGRK